MITNIGHVAFWVSDIEKSVAFYKDILGFREAFRLIKDDGQLGGVYLYIAKDQFIELFPAAAAPSVAAAQTAAPAPAPAPGYSHFCVQVSDAAAAQESVRAKGVSIDTERKTGLSKCRMFWIHDPDGNRIEVMELPPESMQAQATAKFAD
ncbi:MAG: VOC family protein [Clostridiales bacterium]|jgi:lactoylglutathione lyase|nr:VOC family protein [Clostridiales bacterium]